MTKPDGVTVYCSPDGKTAGVELVMDGESTIFHLPEWEAVAHKYTERLGLKEEAIPLAELDVDAKTIIFKRKGKQT